MALAASEVAKRALRAIASGTLGKQKKPEGEEGFPKALAVVLALLAAILMLAATMVLAGPLAISALMDSVSGDDGSRAIIEDALGEDIDADDIVSYKDAEERLEKWARARWDSGTGEDVFHTPSWRYLFALDLAISGSDLSLVEANPDYYEELHRSCLKATVILKTREVECGKGDEGAFTYIGEDTYTASEYDELCARIISGAQAKADAETRAALDAIPVPEPLDFSLRVEVRGNTVRYYSGATQISAAQYRALQKQVSDRNAEIEDALARRAAISPAEAVYTLPEASWLRLEEYWVWSVTYKPMKAVFAPRVDSMFTDEFRSFAGGAGASYGTVWTDPEIRAGLYLLSGDELESFLGFLAYNYAEDLPGVAGWAQESTIEDFAPGFASDWEHAWAEAPQALILAQDVWFSRTYLAPAREALSAAGVFWDGLRDCVKALAGVCVRKLGPEAFAEGLRNAKLADDRDVLEAFSEMAASADGFDGPFFRRLVLKAMDAIEEDPKTETDVPTWCLGDNPEAESDVFDLKEKGILAQRYSSVLRAVTVDKAWFFGKKRIYLDKELYLELVNRDFGQNDIVETAMEIAEDDAHGYSMSRGDGGAGRCMDPDVDCSSFVYYVLLESGYSKEQLGTVPFTTRTMGRLLVAAGFEELDFTGFDDCEYGDIIVRHGEHAHTEIVSGEWQTVGAHDNYDGQVGDGYGNEVSVLDRVTQEDWAGAKVYRR